MRRALALALLATGLAIATRTVKLEAQYARGEPARMVTLVRPDRIIE